MNYNFHGDHLTVDRFVSMQNQRKNSENHDWTKSMK